MQSIRIQAVWDSEADVWVAESDDVPGLVTEAETMEALVQKLRVLIPELFEANGMVPPTDGHNIPFDLRAERHDNAALAIG